MTAGFRLDPKQTQLGNGPFVKTGFGQNLPTQAQDRHNLKHAVCVCFARTVDEHRVVEQPAGRTLRGKNKTKQDNLTRQDKTRQILDR